MSKYIVDIHGDIEGDYEIIKEYEEPKTGQWIEKSYNFDHCSAKCSICGKSARGLSKDTGWGFTYSFTDYCPNCGAKMEREEN